MNDEVKKSSGRPRSSKSHQAILQATLELLAEVGYERMSIEAIARRANVGKTTIYRRYDSKEELLADAIESLREEIIIPDTGNLWGDLEAIIENAAQISLHPLGRQTIAMITGTASSYPQFSQLYWRKYLQPRRQAFAVVLERAKERGEISSDIDSGLVFDLISGIMLYTLIFPPNNESWEVYIRRALAFLLRQML